MASLIALACLEEGRSAPECCGKGIFEANTCTHTVLDHGGHKGGVAASALALIPLSAVSVGLPLQYALQFKYISCQRIESPAALAATGFRFRETAKAAS